MIDTSTFVVRAATIHDTETLARFCRENPGYDIFLTGQLPDESAWVDDFLNDEPPAHFRCTATHKLIATTHEEPNSIIAIMDVSENMIAEGVGHIGLFQVAERLHGSGLAHRLYQSLEDWLRQRGTDVIRLGVLEGNPRGMAFWKRHGYQETRQRQGIAPTGKVHISHVMFKPLAASTLEAYRARVPRDDPSTPE